MAVLDNEQNQKWPYFIFENYKSKYGQNSELAAILVFGCTFRILVVLWFLAVPFSEINLLFCSGRTLVFGGSFVRARLNTL